MKRLSTLFLHLSAATTAALLIAACGGGGSDAPAAVTPAAPAAPSPNVPISQLANYQGTWQRCDVGLSRATPQVAQNSSASRISLNVATTGNTATLSNSILFFTSLDCSGTAYATVTQPGGTIVANGTKTIGGLVVDKLDGSTVGGVTTFSGTNVTSNAAEVVVTPTGGVPFYFDLNVAAATFKGIGLVSAATLDLGGASTLDASGYPIAFRASNGNRFIKQ